MTEVDVPAEADQFIRTCFVINSDSVEAVLAIDSRNYANSDEFSRVRKEAFDEMDRRRVPCEWETRPVRPDSPPSRLPTWAEYRVDLDRKHPLPEDNT